MKSTPSIGEEARKKPDVVSGDNIQSMHSNLYNRNVYKALASCKCGVKLTLIRTFKIHK